MKNDVLVSPTLDTLLLNYGEEDQSPPRQETQSTNWGNRAEGTLSGQTQYVQAARKQHDTKCEEPTSE